MRRMAWFIFLSAFLVGASPLWGQTVSELQDRIAALEAKLACLTTQGSGEVKDIVFEGCNVYIRNGGGDTTTTNSKGNLVIGYNEDDSEAPADRTGPTTS